MTEFGRALAGCMALALMLAGCGPGPSDAERIAARLEKMSAAAQGGDIDDFMDAVADDFIGADGRLDKRALGLLVRRERLARSRISIQRFDTRIELTGQGRARATFRALATGGSGWLPDDGRLWQFETGWRLDGGEWMLISADWEATI